MRKPLASIMSGLLLLAAVVVPPLGIMAFGASSMAVGVLLVVGLYLMLYVAMCTLHRSIQRLGGVVLFFSVALVIIFIHGMLSFVINDTFNISRFSQTYVFLIIFIFGASSLTILAMGLPVYMADFAVKFVFYTLLLSGFATTLGYRAFDNPSAVVFFNENSHYALSFGPFLLYMVVLSNLTKKLLFLILGFLIALSLQSLTLLVVVIAIFFLTLRLKKLLFFALIGITILFTTIDYIDVGYYSSRIDFSDTNTNLSTLSFTNGWEKAFLNLKDSYGIGIGFQQLGFVGSEGEILQILKEMGFENLNLHDGNNVASKLLSEFGILAVMVLFAYFVYFARSAKWLHKVSVIEGKTVDCKKVFFLSCFFMFFIDLFIRGAGYFSSSGFLFIASIVWFVLHPVSWAPSQEQLSDECCAPLHSSAVFD